MAALKDTKTQIISAAMKAVRQYGLEGADIQKISDLAGVSPESLHGYFDSKDQLLAECCAYVERQAARIFERLRFNPLALLADPVGAVKSLWLPFFRFWTAHPDETIFYHRFRDSALFTEYDKNRDAPCANTFTDTLRAAQKVYPRLKEVNQDLLWFHVLTVTVMYAKYVAEGVFPNNQETEDTVFQFLAVGIGGYLRPEKAKRRRGK